MVGTGKTIVVVDDDAGIRESLRFLLALDGFTVEGFDSAASFLAQCDLTHVDCLLIDQGMPETTGLTLSAQLRAFGVTTPIIIVTADTNPDLERLARASGVYAIVHKPFDAGTLQRIIADAIASGPARRP